jgi:hypothetical protein
MKDTAMNDPQGDYIPSIMDSLTVLINSLEICQRAMLEDDRVTARFSAASLDLLDGAMDLVEAVATLASEQE